jgi:alcohol dehydrogenase class IV
VLFRSLAGSIGGEISVPHGAICAALLPHVMSANISALQTRSPEHPALERYVQIGRLLSNDPGSSADAGVQWVQKFCAYAAVQPLSKFGLTEDLFPKIIEKAIISSSMKGNPLILSESELRIILKMSI